MNSRVSPILRSIAAGSTLVIFAWLAVASGGKRKGSAGDVDGGDSLGSLLGNSIKQSCNQIKSMGTCTEYPEGKTFSLAKMACDGDKEAVWGTAKCTNDLVVGTCVDATKDAFYKNETEHYYAPEYTAESAKKACNGDSTNKDKTFTAGDWKPKADEARGSCTRHITGSKHVGPDECEDYPYGTSTESWDVLKMNCSGEGNTLVVGKACDQAAKDRAVSVCTQKDGTVVYNFPPDAPNAKDFCESEPNNGKYAKLTPKKAPAAGGKPPMLTAPKPAPKGK